MREAERGSLRNEVPQQGLGQSLSLTENLRFLDFPHVPDCMQSGVQKIERKREAERGV